MQSKKIVSLADYLGSEFPPAPEAPEPEIAPDISAKDLSRTLLTTKQYRESILRRMVMDELPAAVEVMLWGYAYGKPIDRMEVKNTTSPFDGLSLEELQSRAQFIYNLIREMQMQQEAAREEPTVN